MSCLAGGGGEGGVGGLVWFVGDSQRCWPCSVDCLRQRACVQMTAPVDACGVAMQQALMLSAKLPLPLQRWACMPPSVL